MLFMALVDINLRLVRIEEYNCRRMEKVFKLNTISILPTQISLNTQAFIESTYLTVFKLQVWLNHILLDQTHQIHVSEKQDIDDKIIIQIESKPFRYFPRQLFNRSKVIRFKLVLLRGNQKWQQVQELQTFTIILSQYSYEYGKSNYNEFHQHSVGLYKKSIFFYKILCEYEQQKTISKFSSQDGNDSYIIKINERNKRKQTDQFLLLPLNSLPQEGSFVQADSSVFIQLSKLKPVFRNQLNLKKDMRIKVGESLINAENIDSQLVEVANQNKNLSNSANNLLDLLFYTYLIVCFVVGIIQMSPQKKV